MRWIVAFVVFLVCAAPADAALTLQSVGTFSAPTWAGSPKGDKSRVFVTEKVGYIRLRVDGVKQSTPFLDIHTTTSTSNERGLLSVAFAPDYALSGTFYLYRTNTL